MSQPAASSEPGTKAEQVVDARARPRSREWSPAVPAAAPRPHSRTCPTTNRSTPAPARSAEDSASVPGRRRYDKTLIVTSRGSVSPRRADAGAVPARAPAMTARWPNGPARCADRDRPGRQRRTGWPPVSAVRARDETRTSACCGDRATNRCWVVEPLFARERDPAPLGARSRCSVWPCRPGSAAQVLRRLGGRLRLDHGGLPTWRSWSRPCRRSP